MLSFITLYNSLLSHHPSLSYDVCQIQSRQSEYQEWATNGVRSSHPHPTSQNETSPREGGNYALRANFKSEYVFLVDDSAGK